MADRLAPSGDTGRGKLLLFIAGSSPNSSLALMNLRKVLGKNGHANVKLDVVDVDEEPDRALALRVLVTPTLLWDQQPFGRRLIGDLSSEVDLSAFLT